ncbi:hypothetical protein QBC38DRAFT_458461 [Podospora fimiseda]|uniref:Uncharacterized protein n=1 Tax=Podospora fimiseda TaxID=252190 RepID=A0AAN7BJ93_9PEZI|nr:hypothetical protein QBC38DRAFT_458461 [Podospora fimiseda]
MRIGKLSFTQAKIVDVVWDLAGRQGFDTVNDLISFRQFDIVAYRIHDGWRIGMPNNSVIPYLDRQGKPAISDSVIPYPGTDTDDRLPGFTHLGEAYVEQYGFYGINRTESTWDNSRILEPPVLNITAFYIMPRFYVDRGLWGDDWVHPDTGLKPFQNPENIRYSFNNEVYTLTYIQENGRCQPDSDTYQWGFSYIQLFIVSIIIFIWSVGITILWLQANINFPLTSFPNGMPNVWRRLSHLASEMNGDLAEEKVHMDDSTDQELVTAINKHLQGGRVSFKSRITTGVNKPCVSFKGLYTQNIKRSLGWTVVFGVHVGIMLLAFLDHHGLQFVKERYGYYWWLSLPRSWSFVIPAWCGCLGLYSLFLVGKIKWLLWYLPLLWGVTIVGLLWSHDPLGAPAPEHRRWVGKTCDL